MLSNPVLLPKNRMLSIPHLIVIFIVALVVFGPEKLPELARNLGKVMADFKRATGDFRSTFEDHLRDLERETTDRKIGGGASTAPSTGTTILPPAPTAPVSQIADHSLEAAALPPAPGSVTANEPYLSRSSAPISDHALDDDPKSFSEVQTEVRNEVHQEVQENVQQEVPPESTPDSVSNGRKRPG